MDFARKELAKYGWSEGKGLGKNEDGIETAIKPKLKFDHAGIGHNGGEQFTNNWWEKLYNNATNNIKVETKREKVKMKIKSKESIEITTKSYSVKDLKKDNDLAYGSFLKTAKLTQDGVEQLDYKIKPIGVTTSSFKQLTDDELFAACGGRTAHKGARHGLKLNGKLSRVEKQEKLLLKKMKKVSLSDNEEKDHEKKLKKLKKQKEANRESYTCATDESLDSLSSNGLKKKKKKRKSVTFNETVTKIYRVDLDTSFESEVGSAKGECNNEQNLENVASGSDEGIEHDIENNNDLVDHHSSFEVARVKFDDISKAERKKLKKKRLLSKKQDTKTAIFLQKLKDENDRANADSFSIVDINSKKRKFLEDHDFEENTLCYSTTESLDNEKRKKNKKKRKKEKLEEKQINSIVKSLDSVCRISESE